MASNKAVDREGEAPMSARLAERAAAALEPVPPLPPPDGSFLAARTKAWGERDRLVERIMLVRVPKACRHAWCDSHRGAS